MLHAFGEFDLVTIMDLPDDAAAAALSLAVTSSGRVKSLRTHRLISAEGAPEMFSKRTGGSRLVQRAGWLESRRGWLDMCPGRAFPETRADPPRRDLYGV